MKTKLGQQADYKDTYWPESLDFVPRALGRSGISAGLFGKNGTANGVDIWHAYEFSWLDNDGSPDNAILRIIVPSTSANIVESKSLKLYLGSFTFEKVQSIQQIVETIQKDLSKGTGATVDVQALNIDASTIIPAPAKGYCIDLHSLRKPSFEYNKNFLRCSSEQREELLYTHSFRSLCPVTSQPDWATVYVMYKGNEIIPEDLRRYLVSFRRHQGFHEACCETIYDDIFSICSPEELSVMCCFTRRGGLDINPIRSNSTSNRLQFMRAIRQ